MLVRLLAAFAFLTLATPSRAAAQPAETPVEAQGPAGLLRGTMRTPAAGAAPVALIIPGSGPTDRDGNSPRGVRAAAYRLLAEALAERGVSTVRIDKRGMFGSAAAGLDANAVVIPDYVADVRAWTSAIRQRTNASCVWIAGHSEGALVALVAAQSNSDICGLVLIAGIGRKFGDVLREQIHANAANAPLFEASDRIIADLEAGRRVDGASIPQLLQPLFAPQVQGFLISAFSYDPTALLRAYAGPVLVLQGASDLQVSMADAETLAAARPGIQLVRLDGVNHVLKRAPADDRAANIASYADPNLPLASGIADSIAAFIVAHPSR